ncbi:hypothetical protein ACAG20_01400 [Mycobacterium sp. pW045]
MNRPTDDDDVTTIQAVELGVLGPLQARHTGAPVIIPGAKPRAILTMLGLHGGSVVSAETLIDLLWGDDPPRTAGKAHRLSTLGAVVTHVAQGLTKEGFDAEWHGVAIVTVHGDSVNRCELFDEDDLAAALARFDELDLPASPPEDHCA